MTARDAAAIAFFDSGAVHGGPDAPTSAARIPRPRSAPQRTAQPTAAESDRDGVKLVRLSDVRPEPVRWLWSDRIPLGKITVLDGDPGLGKSMITLDLAARVSTGSPMPDATSAEKVAGVVLLSLEDDRASTIRPRLDAAGADATRIVALDSIGTRTPTLTDLAAIEQAAVSVDARLIVIDPLMAYLPVKTDSHRDQDIRALLAPLGQLASRIGAAIVIVRHLNKTAGGNALYRGGGSIGIVGAARSGLLVARDPSDPQRRILAVTKSNLAAEATSLAYRIDACDDVARVTWLGATKHTAADLVAVPANKARDALTEARDWLAAELRDGSQPVEEIRRAARSAGIADRTLDRAKSKLRVHAAKSGGSRAPWTWSLPTTAVGALGALSEIAEEDSKDAKDANLDSVSAEAIEL